MQRFSMQDELKYLRKQNRILKRQLGQLKKDLKVDVKLLRAEAYLEGYETGRLQMTPEIYKCPNCKENNTYAIHEFFDDKEFRACLSCGCQYKFEVKRELIK